MRYALLGDLHSSIEDLEKVLEHIRLVASDAEVVGLGDLFECTIGKKRAVSERFTKIDDVILHPEGFEELLTFPSVKGNQEERILMITTDDDPLLRKLEALPETIQLEGGVVIHGHQWHWSGDPWRPEVPPIEDRIVFFGHSHQSAYYINQWVLPEFGTAYPVPDGKMAVNVGSVIENREWVLYDSEQQLIVFHRA